MRGISISRAMHHYLCEKTVSVLFGKIAAKRTKKAQDGCKCIRPVLIPFFRRGGLFACKFILPYKASLIQDSSFAKSLCLVRNIPEHAKRAKSNSDQRRHRKQNHFVKISMPSSLSKFCILHFAFCIFAI